MSRYRYKQDADEVAAAEATQQCFASTSFSSSGAKRAAILASEMINAALISHVEKCGREGISEDEIVEGHQFALAVTLKMFAEMWPARIIDSATAGEG